LRGWRINGSAHVRAAQLQTSLADAVDNPWLLAVGEDLHWPETRGRRSLTTSLVNAYIARVHQAAVVDDGIATAFYRVMHMLEEPAALFQPRRIIRILSRSMVGARPTGATTVAPEGRQHVEAFRLR
jgi:hypothetical protein